MCRSPLMFSGLVALLAVGCSTPSGEEDDSPGFVETTPTPYVTVTYTPTPGYTDTPGTPTPVPSLDYYVTRFKVEENDGVDLDGDGKEDNLYVELIDDVYDVIKDGFQETCVTTLGQFELPDSLPPVEALCRTLSATVTQLLESLISVEGMNTNMEEALLQVNYLVQVRQDGEELTLVYSFGGYDGSYFYVDTEIGEQEGELIGEEAQVGESDFQLAFDLDGDLVYMYLVESQTRLILDEDGLSEPLLGAILTEENLLDLLGQSILLVAAIPEPALEALLKAVGATIPDCGEDDTVMEDCGDYDGIPMAVSYEFDAAEIYTGEEF